MRRELTGAGLAVAVMMGGVFVGTAATAQPGGDTVTQAPAAAAGPVKDPDAPRERATGFGPQGGVDYDAGVGRVWGDDRYDTAAMIARVYGWTPENTLTVYIASGQGYADALAMGPSTWDDGPLLLVKRTGIPAQTAEVLAELQPCYINISGGTTSVSKSVFNSLKQYANPDLCQDL